MYLFARNIWVLVFVILNLTLKLPAGDQIQTGYSKFLDGAGTASNIDFVNQCAKTVAKDGIKLAQAIKDWDANEVMAASINLLENLPFVGSVFTVSFGVFFGVTGLSRPEPSTTKSPVLLFMEKMWNELKERLIDMNKKLDFLIQNVQDVKETVIAENRKEFIRKYKNNIVNAEKEYGKLMRSMSNLSIHAYLKLCVDIRFYPTQIANVIVEDNSEFLSHLASQENLMEYFKWASYIMSYYYKSVVLNTNCIALNLRFKSNLDLANETATIKNNAKTDCDEMEKRIQEDAFQKINPYIKIFRKLAGDDKGKLSLPDFANKLFESFSEITDLFEYSFYFIIWEPRLQKQYLSKKTAYLFPFNITYNSTFLQSKRKFSYAHYEIGKFNRSMILYLLRKLPDPKKRTNMFAKHYLKSYETTTKDWEKCSKFHTLEIADTLKFKIELKTVCEEWFEEMLDCYPKRKRRLWGGCLLGPIETRHTVVHTNGIATWPSSCLDDDDDDDDFLCFPTFSEKVYADFIVLNERKGYNLLLFMIDTFIDDCVFENHNNCP